MIFNSFEFALFLPIVFLLYWLIVPKGLKYSNLFLTISSYFFYGWWDWKFLGLIIISTFIDYYAAKIIAVSESPKIRKRWLTLSLCSNLGILGFFKYFNFFVQSFIDSFSFFGHQLEYEGLSIVLPVGISFYTFQTLSYSIDVYRKKLEPAESFISFAAFVCFFPQLVAGPIERATNLLPQFYTKKKFNHAQAVDGLRQILWGFFQKIVIADNAAVIVNDIFANYSSFSGSTLLVGGIFFAFQIYGDFSGYSNIAIGLSRLFGFNLMQNFAFPYFSRDIAEFWRRWHISLSTWFRDYLYIPLGGSRGGTLMKVRNTFIIFLVSGFWHGANWTFVVWGAINAFYFLPLLLSKKNRVHTDDFELSGLISGLVTSAKMLKTFLLSVLAWIFFRADTVSQASEMIGKIFSSSLFVRPHSNHTFDYVMQVGVVIVLMLFIEWHGRKDTFAIQKIGLQWPRPLRVLFYHVIVLLIVLFVGKNQDFIYFQF